MSARAKLRQVSLFEEQRWNFNDALRVTIESLKEYATRYEHWAIAYSGGKDSTALVTVVVHLIASGQVPAPKSLVVLYADTRMELPPLQASAMGLLRVLEEMGVRTQVVLPVLEERFMVYMLGRGVPPPKNRFRWCTSQIKIEPMLAALIEAREAAGGKMLMLTGVRLGESAQRDARIVMSCSRDGAECGQGWFQEATPESVADTLAPLLHWRVCFVWDWLFFRAPQLGFPTSAVAEAYGGDEAEEANTRTGCVGCNLTSQDWALDLILENPDWWYLAPFKRLRPLYAALTLAHSRLRKDGTEKRVDGSLVKNPQRLGPLTMEARLLGLSEVLAIQAEINAAAVIGGRPLVSLIDAEEEAKIRDLIVENTWPERWDGSEPNGAEILPEVMRDGSIQEQLFYEVRRGPLRKDGGAL